MIVIDDWSKLLDRPEICLEAAVLRATIEGRRVLITGAGGSIGRALTRTASNWLPDRLVCLDSHEASLVHLQQQIRDYAGSVDVHYVLGDVRDQRKLEQIFRRFRIDVVFHLAAYKQVPLAEDNIDQVIGVNLVGTLNVLEAAVEHASAVLVYPSTDKAVHPPSIYGMTKRVAERMLLAVGRERTDPAVRVIRLVNVFGTQGSVIELFAQQIAAGQPLTITDLRMDRYWITMNEAVQLLLGAACQTEHPGIYMLDVGKPVLMTETARRVYALLCPGRGDPQFRLIGSRSGERIHEELSYPSETVVATRSPGLLRLAQPIMARTAESWLGDLCRLRQIYYQYGSEQLRTWLVERAVEEPPNGVQAPAAPGVDA